VSFLEYKKISGLRLNIVKTVFVPLFKQEVVEVRARLHAFAHTWGDFCIAGKAKYLGGYLGPEAGNASWVGPLAKYLDRVKQWALLPIGLAHTLEAYRLYIASVLSFVAQFMSIPAEFKAAEALAVKRLFPGSKDWISAAALHSAKRLSLPCNLVNLESIAIASQARMAMHEDFVNGGLRVEARADSLTRTFGVADNMERAWTWRSWLETSIVLRLRASLGTVLRLEAGSNAPHALARPRGDYILAEFRAGWQARAYALHRGDCPTPLLRHARRRLDRWRVAALPGHRTARLLQGLAEIKSLVPPRALAAKIRAAFNGWPTTWRFQQNGRCCLNCGVGQDSIEHYSVCAEYHRLCGRYLALHRPVVDELGAFLGLHRTSCEELAKRALAFYALYRTFNGVRCGLLRPAEGADAFRAFLQEGVRGHPAASALLRSNV